MTINYLQIQVNMRGKKMMHFFFKKKGGGVKKSTLIMYV